MPHSLARRASSVSYTHLVEHAEEEGIVFKTLTNPTEVLGDENGWVKGMTCVEMGRGEPEASGRRRPP